MLYEKLALMRERCGKRSITAVLTHSTFIAILLAIFRKRVTSSWKFSFLTNVFADHEPQTSAVVGV